MSIWINGAFGSGKTQTAFEHRRLSNTHVADPELLGFALGRMLPLNVQPDFQDLPQRRSAAIETLVRAEASHAGPLLVPMTIVRDDYFDEIVGGIRARGTDLHHYALIVGAATLRRRLSTRSRLCDLVCVTRPGRWSRSRAVSPP